VNSQGKITLVALRSLFRPPESAGADADRPLVFEQFRGGGYLERLCRVPKDLGCFSGHFPGHPVVPGALQLDWVMDVAAELLDAPPRIAELESLKLPASLGPGDVFRIHVRSVSNNKIDFTISAEGVDYAKGRVRLAQGPRSGLQP
jgi:3-hydroxymyristoyl/3-hydroxydecanoyl-(acyl carrier protein) dehydratase